MEGKPLSREEIGEQRKHAASRRHVSRDAERLLRGTAQSSTSFQASAEGVAAGKTGELLAAQTAAKALQGERSRSPDQASSRAAFSKCSCATGLKAARRVR